MSTQKNVASQKIGLVMVDATDFATPETGIGVSAIIRKDGGASAALSNTVSELSEGFYVVTLSQAETNANLLQMRFHDGDTSCADQYIVVYPDSDNAQLSGILSTIDGPVLTDTAAISNINTDDFSAALSQILEDTTSILVDTKTTIPATITTIDNEIDSILKDTTSILIDTTSILVDTKTTLQNQVASILVDTKTTIPATITTIDNEIDSILADTKTTIPATITIIDNEIDSVLNNTTSILVDTTSILVDTKTTLDNKIDSILVDTTSILVDTKTTLDDKLDSILVDTGTTLYDAISDVKSAVDAVVSGDSSGTTSALALLKDGTVGLNALETIVSDVLSTIDGPVIKNISDLDSYVLEHAQLGSSELSEIHSQLARTDYGLAALETVVSDILSTLDGPVLTTVDNKIDSILQDTQSLIVDASDINSAIDALTTADSSGMTSALALLKDATYGLDALETVVSAILTDTGATLQDQVASILVDTKTTIPATITTIDNEVGSILADTGATLDNKIDSILVDTTSILVDTGTTLFDFISDVDSAVNAVATTDSSGTTSALALLKDGTYGLNALETIVSDVLSTIDGPLLTDTGTTLDNKIDSILVDTTRTIQTLTNKMTITDADGATVLRNDDDSSNLATWGITDDDTTTTRTEATWV